MNKLYYGNGICTIEGTQIRGVEIRYHGHMRGGAAKKEKTLKIRKVTDNNFAIVHNNSKIIIFPVGEGFLNKLFHYSGELIIKSVVVADNNGEQVTCVIKKIMDHAELLNTKPEDLTTKVDRLSSSYSSPRKFREYDGIIRNLYSEDEFYLSNGSLYTGAYHIYLKDNRCMTGDRHTQESEDLYIKQMLGGVTIDKLISTKNSSHVPQALAFRRKRRRMKFKKTERK